MDIKINRRYMYSPPAVDYVDKNGMPTKIFVSENVEVIETNNIRSIIRFRDGRLIDVPNIHLYKEVEYERL